MICNHINDNTGKVTSPENTGILADNPENRRELFK